MSSCSDSGRLFQAVGPADESERSPVMMPIANMLSDADGGSSETQQRSHYPADPTFSFHSSPSVDFLDKSLVGIHMAVNRPSFTRTQYRHHDGVMTRYLLRNLFVVDVRAC